MPKGYGIDFGWCGFGTHAGPPKVYRLGWFLIVVFPDGIALALKSYRAALMIKKREVVE